MVVAVLMVVVVADLWFLKSNFLFVCFFYTFRQTNTPLKEEKKYLKANERLKCGKIERMTKAKKKILKIIEMNE